MESKKLPGPQRIGDILKSTDLGAHTKQAQTAGTQRETRGSRHRPRSTQTSPKRSDETTAQTLAVRLRAVEDPKRRRDQATFYDGSEIEPLAHAALRAVEYCDPRLNPIPAGDEQPDLFVTPLYDVKLRDHLSLLDFTPFRISHHSRQPEIVCTTRNGTQVAVTGDTKYGILTAHDYDAVLFLVSHLVAAANRGEAPSPTIEINAYDLLRFCRRSDGGRQYTHLECILNRILGTNFHITTHQPGYTDYDHFTLISQWTARERTANQLLSRVTVTVHPWLYEGLVLRDKLRVTKLDPDYFLISSGLDRALYRFAKRWAGQYEIRVPFTELHAAMGHQHQPNKLRNHLSQMQDQPPLLGYRFAHHLGPKGGSVAITPDLP